MRRVTKTATVSLYANRYEVDPGLVGRNVELRFDPEDLSVIDWSHVSPSARPHRSRSGATSIRR